MTRPVFPAVPPERGHYESFYLRAVDPREPRGLWLRHTVHQRPGHPPTASLWTVLFERGRPPSAAKATHPATALGHGDGHLIRIADATFSLDHAHGPSWDLRLRDAAGTPPLRHLPAERLYVSRLPRTKTESPRPRVEVSGRFAVGEREVEADAWEGMVGHNWGEEHAERWLWLNALALGGHGAWLDLAIGRVRTGPLTTPWIANGAIVLPGGERHRLGGLQRIRPLRIAERPDGVRFVVRGERGIRVEGAIDAPRHELVGWSYADPGGAEHDVVNCSIARVRLDVELPGRDPQRLESPHGGVFELGMREQDHGVPIRPERDG